MMKFSEQLDLEVKMNLKKGQIAHLEYVYNKCFENGRYFVLLHDRDICDAISVSLYTLASQREIFRYHKYVHSELTNQNDGVRFKNYVLYVLSGEIKQEFCSQFGVDPYEDPSYKQILIHSTALVKKFYPDRISPLMIDNVPYFRSSDIAKSLGYKAHNSINYFIKKFKDSGIINETHYTITVNSKSVPSYPLNTEGFRLLALSMPIPDPIKVDVLSYIDDFEHCSVK